MKLGYAAAGLAVGAALVLAYRASNRPAALDAAATCSALVRAACERQDACPGCRSPGVNRVPCSAVVAAELPACVGRAAPGETFSSQAVGDCQRAFLGQSCPDACASFTDPPACAPFLGLSGG